MKQQVAELALFGGQPSFSDVLHVGRPNIGDRQRLMARIDDMLDRRWLTNRGPYVQELEAALAAYLGVKHCVTICNATVALEITFRALGLSGEVIVPSFTFVATAHALQWQEITPVFCDISPDSPTVDPAQVEAMITPRTTGIVGVHVWGHPCDVAGLTAVAEGYNLSLIFDAAHALGCTVKGEPIGRFGDAEVFSFHATKFLNSFEGGAVATNNDELANKIRLMQNFGFAGMDNVIYIGTNGKMSEVSAAMGLTSLESISEFISTNYENYKAYKQALVDIPGVSLQTYDEREKGNYQYIVIEVDESKAGVSRDRLVEILHAENVRARRYFYPGVHQMEPYRSYFPHAGLLLPETERLTQRVICLPTGTSIGAEEIKQLCQLVRLVVEKSEEIEASFVNR